MKYQTPQVTIIHFSPQDVLTSSEKPDRAAWQLPDIDLDFF